MFRRLLSFLMTIALILGLAPLSVSTAESTGLAAAEESAMPDALVIPHFSMSYIKNRADIIDGFDTPTSVSLWKPLSNVSTVSAETSFPDYPFDPVEGARCLNAVGADSDASAWHYIERVYESPLDLSDYASLMLALSVRRLSDGGYTATVILTTASGTSKRYNAAISPDCWNAVMLDLSGLAGRDKIVKIRVGIKHDYPDTVIYPYNFQLDCIAASADRQLAQTAVFMSGAYKIYGGESRLSYTYGSLNESAYEPMAMTVSIASTLASRCFIESGALTDGLFSSGEAIRIRMVNESDCDSVTLEYATAEQPDYSQNPAQTLTLASDREVQSLYFSSPAVSPTQIRVTFNNVADGQITIYSIGPFSYYLPIDSAYSALLSENGGLSSCRISDDGKKILIRGFLDEAVAQGHKSSTVELYELTPDLSNESIYSAETAALDSTSVSEQFEFELPVYADDGHSRLCSRFAAVLSNKDKSRTILLGSPRYITNPEILSDNSAQYTIPASKKGMTAEPSALLDVGAAWTELTFNLGHLFTTEESGIGFEYGGKTYYLDRAYVDELDADICDANIAGCAVRLRMVLTKPTSSDYALTLIHPFALSRSTSFYAFNTESADGVKALECAAAFIAGRYMTAQNGVARVCDVIVGSDIDAAYANYNMGKLTCRDFVDSYTRAFRIIYNTVRSISPKSRVYVSLGNSWDGLRSCDASIYHLGADLCDVITAQLSAEGAIQWRLALDPYAENNVHLTDYSASASALNSSVSFANLPAICTVLSRPHFLSDGTQRGLLVSTFSPIVMFVEETEPLEAAAEYCRAYLIVCSDACSVTDGLTLRPGISDETYEMFKYLDTDDSAAHLSALKSYYGVSELTELVSGYRAGMLSGRILTESKWSENLPPEIKGGVTVSTFGGDEDLAYWSTPSGVTLSAVESFKGYQNMAFVKFGNDSSFYAMLNRFDYPLDLSYAPYISFNCYTEGISAYVNDLTLTVTLFSGTDSASYTGALNAGMWDFIVCDLGDFSKNKSVDGISLRLDSNLYDLSGATLVVGEIQASSVKFESDYLESKFREQRDKYLSANRAEADNKTIWALIALIITALTVELIYIMNRIRKIDIRNKMYEESRKYRY